MFSYWPTLCAKKRLSSFDDDKTLYPFGDIIAVSPFEDNNLLSSYGDKGIIRLPIHLWWSGESIERDLTIAAQRRRVYEIVLQVGSAEDVEHFIDPRRLCADWDNMIRPAAVIET